MILPDTQTSIETITAKPEAIEFADKLIKQNQELSDIYAVLQPLLYELSVRLYGEDGSTITLSKLVEDSIKFIKENPNESTTESEI